MPSKTRTKHLGEFIVKLERERDTVTATDSRGRPLFTGPLTRVLEKRLRGKLRAYYYAHTDNLGRLVLGWRAPAQPW